MVEGHVPARGWGFKSPFAHGRVWRRQVIWEELSASVCGSLEGWTGPTRAG
jgi:hypothetical protein